MTLTELFAAIAAAIRSKDGTTAPIPATTFPERIRAISGSGGGGGGPFAKVSVLEGPDCEVNVPVNISARVSVTAEKYYTHFLYNGVRLPRIPDSVLASYPYAWIRNNTTSGYYDLIMSNLPFFKYDTGLKDGDSVYDIWYRTPISSPTTWEQQSHTYGSWGLNSARTVLWSNFDIPNGSATATDIYFEGTEPVPTD